MYVPSVFAISQPNLNEIAWNFNQSIGITISIYVCNAREVILVLFGTINFTTKDWLQPVWTGFFRVVDRLGLVFKGPVVVPEYLNQSQPVAVANCLVLGKKKPDVTGLEKTIGKVVFSWCVSAHSIGPTCPHSSSRTPPKEGSFSIRKHFVLSPDCLPMSSH